MILFSRREQTRCFVLILTSGCNAMTFRQKFYWLCQYYLNKRMVTLSLNGIVICFGMGHLAGFISPSGNQRVAEYLAVIITTIGVLFFLFFCLQLAIFLAKDLVILLSGAMSDKKMAAIQSGCHKRYVLSSGYVWWRRQPFRWFVVLFPLLNLFLVFLSLQDRNVLLLRPPAMLLAVPYSILNGLMLLALFLSFRFVEESRSGKPLRSVISIQELALALSVYLVGQVMGQVASLNRVLGFINERFPAGMQTEELVVEDWRMSERWCHGQQVGYEQVMFPFADKVSGERILCLPSEYKGRFRKGTKIYASGPGTAMGTTVKTIASPDNGIAEIPTPKWE